MRFGFLVFFAFFICCGFAAFPVFAQPTWTLDPFGSEKKPEQYQEKKLGSEKTADKKFTPVRHFLQNTVSHYNYYFNANNKINMVLEQAKLSNKDNYSKLLPFYAYTLDVTSAQQVELDSVIYKATAGILLHDLRNDWIDDLYLLIGKAYFFRKTLDTAAMTFQFINYNMYPRKKGEDDGRIVGSNTYERGSMFSIADKEDRNVLQKAFTLPPCRNDALIWLARTFTEAEMYSDATGIINILHNDPNLPERLQDDLEEVTAYWFYRQEIYDSCAVHLEKALSNAETPSDRARWEYLLAQLYQMNKDYGKASGFYLKSAKIAIDPVMDIYAHLNNATMSSGKGDSKELQADIDNLLKMARKDKYTSYRDIIYNAAGRISLLRPDTAGAITCFQKSLKYNEGNEPFRNKSYLALADLYYATHDYRNASAFYDSLNASDPELEADTALIADRKAVLNRVVELIDIVRKEDSLQRIANMSPAERDAFIRQLVKKYRKEKGLKETEGNAGYVPVAFGNNKDAATDLFASSAKGEWYFYNASMRSKGLNDFKLKWGTRPNTDNWRRIKAVESDMKNLNANIDIDAPPSDSDSGDQGGAGKLVPFSYDALMADVPLTAEKLDSSRSKISAALLALAAIFQSELMDYPEAIRMYEDYLSRFPSGEAKADVYLGLQYCYGKIGDQAKSDEYKNLLLKEFADSRAAKILTNPQSMAAGQETKEGNKMYEGIYNLFIEGRFEEALAAKKKADSESGTAYWTPQLLYIEAVYYVKQRQDSAAIAVLDDLVTRFPESPLKEKAETLRGVVSRRAEIEGYLSQLDVTRQQEDRVIISESRQAPVQKTDVPKAQPQVVMPVAPVNRPQVPAADTLKNLPGMAAGSFLLEPEKPHLVLMVLDRVDGVYVSEALNAMSRFNRDNSAYRNVLVKKEAVDAARNLLVFSSFEDAGAALAYFDKIKKSAPNYVSWLQPAKYFFLIITENNLSVLRQNKDLQQYRNLLNSQYGNKF